MHASFILTSVAHAGVMAAFLSGNIVGGVRPTTPLCKPARLQICAAGNGSNGVAAPLPTVTDIYGTTAALGPEMNVGGKYSMPTREPEPISAEVQALIDEQGIDFEQSHLKYLSNEARVSLFPCPAL